ncbi:MAG: hypothetical protein MJY92_04135 [Bacteroidales bacterium]|nr:hypothetical protein [Bacteroidales bacterium]
MAEYKSRSAVVDRPQMVLFQAFTSLEAMLAAVPQDKRKDITVEGDTVRINYAGFTIAVAITEKQPFSKVVFQDVEAPFHFTFTLHFDPAELITQTTLWMEVNADIPFMMKALIGPKIQEALDTIVMQIANGGFIQQ